MFFTTDYFNPNCFEVDTKFIENWDEIINQTKESKNVKHGQFYSGSIISSITVPLPQDLKGKEFLYLYANGHETKIINSLSVGLRYEYNVKNKKYQRLNQYQPTSSLCTDEISRLPSFITNNVATDKFNSAVINPNMVLSDYNIKGSVKTSDEKTIISPDSALLITVNNTMYVLVDWPSNPEGCDKTQSLYMVNKTANPTLIKTNGGGCN